MQSKFELIWNDLVLHFFIYVLLIHHNRHGHHELCKIIIIIITPICNINSSSSFSRSSSLSWSSPQCGMSSVGKLTRPVDNPRPTMGISRIEYDDKFMPMMVTMYTKIVWVVTLIEVWDSLLYEYHQMFPFQIKILRTFSQNFSWLVKLIYDPWPKNEHRRTNLCRIISKCDQGNVFLIRYISDGGSIMPDILSAPGVFRVQVSLKVTRDISWIWWLWWSLYDDFDDGGWWLW